TKVFRSSHDALADWRLSVRRGAVKCLVLFVLSGAATPNDRVTSSAMLSPPLGVRSAAFRIGAKTSLNGRPVRVWFDVLAITAGRSFRPACGRRWRATASPIRPGVAPGR